MPIPVIYELAIRARSIRRNLGTRCAAGFLRNRNIPLDVALYVLLGTTERA